MRNKVTNILYVKTYLFGITTSVFLVPILVFAQKKYEQSISGLFEYTKDIVNDLVLWLFTTGAVVCFIAYLVYYIYTLSQGKIEKDAEKDMKKYILYGLIALTVMFTFYAISSLLAVTFGIQIGIPQFFQDQDGLGAGSGKVGNTRSIITY